MTDDVRDQAEALNMAAPIGERVVAVCRELFTSLGLQKEGTFQRHHDVCDSSRITVAQLWKRMAIVL